MARPKQPVDMLKWARQARNGLWVFCLVYGEEHWEERSAALDRLIRLHEEKPRKYTIPAKPYPPSSGNLSALSAAANNSVATSGGNDPQVCLHHQLLRQQRLLQDQQQQGRRLDQLWRETRVVQASVVCAQKPSFRPAVAGPPDERQPPQVNDAMSVQWAVQVCA